MFLRRSTVRCCLSSFPIVYLFLERFHVVCLAVLAEHLHLHPLLKERKRFREVADTELVLGVRLCVLRLKIEPLLVAFRVCVHLAVQVVLLYNGLILCAHPFDVRLSDWLHFCPVKVTTFNRRVKLQVVRALCSPVSLGLRQIFIQCR